MAPSSDLFSSATSLGRCVCIGIHVLQQPLFEFHVKLPSSIWPLKITFLGFNISPEIYLVENFFKQRKGIRIDFEKVFIAIRNAADNISHLMALN